MKSKHIPTYGNLLHRLEKPRAKFYYLYSEDAEDPWFVYVRKMDKKTNKEIDRSMFVAKDIPQWLDWQLRSGWANPQTTPHI